jgi:hypothetical protein
LLSTHRWKDSPDEEERRHEIQIERVSPFIDRQVAKPTGLERSTSIVYQDVDPTVVFEHRGNEGLDRCGVPHIAGIR